VLGRRTDQSGLVKEGTVVIEVKFFLYTRHPKTRTWKGNSALGICTNFRFGRKEDFQKNSPAKPGEGHTRRSGGQSLVKKGDSW